MDYVLETKSLLKSYRHVEALSGVDMHVPKDSIYGLVGRNGAGKTTLMRVVAGMQKENGGTYLLFGVDKNSREIKKERKRVGAMIESPAIFHDLSAEDNLKMQYRILGLPSFDTIPEILSTVGLENTGNKKAGSFSFGMKQRLGIAMAIAGNAASTFATFLAGIYLFFFYQKRKKGIWKDIRESKGEYKKEKRGIIMKRILAISIPISLASIVSAINRNIDTFTVVNGLKTFLTGFSESIDVITEEATRLYGILSGKVDMLIGMPAALNIAFATALVPAVSAAMANGDIKTAKRRMTFSLRTTLLIAFPCAILTLKCFKNLL